MFLGSEAAWSACVVAVNGARILPHLRKIIVEQLNSQVTFPGLRLVHQLQFFDTSGMGSRSRRNHPRRHRHNAGLDNHSPVLVY